MLSFSLYCSSWNNKQPTISPRTSHTHPSRICSRNALNLRKQNTSSLNCKPLREGQMKKKGRGFGTVCYSGPLTPANLQWVSAVSTVAEYGIWTAFLALIVRLFYYIPGMLELPFTTLLFVILAPHQVMRLRGTQEGAILSLILAGYLAFQHFSRIGSVERAFDQGSVLATLATICIVVVPCLFFV